MQSSLRSCSSPERLSGDQRLNDIVYVGRVIANLLTILISAVLG